MFDEPGSSDFDGWLYGMPGWKWGLCEACGTHRFDDAGRSQCAANTFTPLGTACPVCEAVCDVIDDANAARRQSASLVVAITREMAALALDMAALVIPGRLGRDRVHGLAVRAQPRGFEW